MLRDGGETQLLRNMEMDVKCTTGARESWTLEACDKSCKTWAVCEKHYGEDEEEDRK